MIEPMKNKAQRMRTEQHDLKMARRIAERQRQESRQAARNDKRQAN